MDGKAKPAPRRRPSAWELASRALLVLLSLAAALGIGEGLARLLRPVPSASSVWPGFDEQLRSGMFIPDPELGFRPGPAWAPEGRFGFSNGAEYDGAPAGGLDVAIIGDSLVADGLLGDALKERLAATTARVWVAGIGGYNTSQEARYLERWITLAPDVLVLVFCLNDFGPSLIVVPAGEGQEWRFVNPDFEPLAAVNPLLFRSSALYRRFRAALVARRVREQYSPEGVRRYRERTRAALQRIQRYAAERRAPLLVMLYPHLVEVEAPWQREAHQQALALFRELALRHVDVTQAFLARGMRSLRRSGDDSVHPSREGHAIAARALLGAFPEVFEGGRRPRVP